jgi:hypothetical protein
MSPVPAAALSPSKRLVILRQRSRSLASGSQRRISVLRADAEHAGLPWTDPWKGTASAVPPSPKIRSRPRRGQRSPIRCGFP